MSETITIASQPMVHAGFTNRSGIISREGRNTDEKATFRLPVWIWLLSGALATWGAFSVNPLLTPVAILILIASIQLLWRRGEPPVLAFACAMQWLQATAVIFYTDFYGTSLAQAGGSPEFETATWLSLIAVFVLALGMRIALFRCRYSQHARLVAEALHVNIAN